MPRAVLHDSYALAYLIIKKPRGCTIVSVPISRTKILDNSNQLWRLDSKQDDLFFLTVLCKFPSLNISSFYHSAVFGLAQPDVLGHLN